MRLIVNRDEVASFRKLVSDEIAAGSQKVSITLWMNKESAEDMLARSSDNGPPIECVWSGGLMPQPPQTRDERDGRAETVL